MIPLDRVPPTPPAPVPPPTGSSAARPGDPIDLTALGADRRTSAR